MIQKKVQDRVARACLTVVLLFFLYKAADAFAADAISSLLYHLGMLCIIANLLASPSGQLLPPRDATITRIHEQIQHGIIARVSRLQVWLFILGFVLLVVSACIAVS